MLLPLVASVQIDIDVTVFIQFVTFSVALFSIWGIIITPYLKAREAREEGTSGSREEADELEALSTQRLADYEEKLAKIRREAMDTREALRVEGTKSQQALIDEARAEVNAKTREEQGKIAQLVADAEAQLDTRASALASQMIQKILPAA